ncbi:MAG TPA: Crp/Fnr family transcriptional regulator [Draconibacterium sp.]|nr:Crp/Fnr family transcriptional regulator [Draconibacterium sp.]
MNLEPLTSYFSKYIPLNEEEVAFLKTVVTEKNVKRRQLILKQGDVCLFNSFVVKGCFRMYMVDGNGKEHNLQFAIEDGWILDMDSFYSEKPGKLYIEALENSIIYQIKKEGQLKLYINLPKFNHIFRVLCENAYISSQRRVLQNISSTAEERYLDFINRYPLLVNRISNVQIASFLGVTPEFLSVIRSRLVKP